MPDKIKGSVLVVGGGIAGMQAALDLADSGYYVYLLEKSPSIGGAMAHLSPMRIWNPWRARQAISM